MKRAEAYRRRLLDQGRTLEELAVKQAINLMKQEIKEIMDNTKTGRDKH